MAEEHIEPISNGESKNAAADVSVTLEQLESLEIPAGIDQKLWELWLERERNEIEKKNHPVKKDKVRQGRSLNVLFAAYIGIVVMCFSIILGFLQEKEPTEILLKTCQVFLFYSFAGFVFGCLVDYYVRESVETLLRDIIRRNNAAR